MLSEPADLINIFFHGGALLLQMYALQCAMRKKQDPRRCGRFLGVAHGQPVCKWPTPSALARVAVCGDAGSLEAAAAQCFET